MDAVVFSRDGSKLKVLLVKRKDDPFAGRWALPGGFIDIEEPSREAVARELMEETGIKGLKFEELGVFGDPGRDPRGRIVSLAYLAVARETDRIRPPRGGSDAADAKWFSAYRPPPLAFDHRKILARARKTLREEALYGLRAFDFLSKKFTLQELRRAYEATLGRKISDSVMRGSFVARKLLRRVKSPTKSGRQTLYELRPNASELLELHQCLLRGG